MDLPSIVGITFWATMAAAIALPLICCARATASLRRRAGKSRSLAWTEIVWSAVPVLLLALLVLRALGDAVRG